MQQLQPTMVVMMVEMMVEEMMVEVETNRSQHTIQRRLSMSTCILGQDGKVSSSALSESCTHERRHSEGSKCVAGTILSGDG
mmetsp:Transcript_52992/g.137092  ORF Transcript_52992/g.137092 Transcript_52992/m.137092 type:complete len:82 (+) Transcript_52992:553-798(+)